MSLLNPPLEDLYQGRSPAVLLRARAMWVTYVAGALGTCAILANDLMFGQLPWVFHLAVDGSMLATLALGCVAVLRRRDDAAALVVPVLLVIFSSATILRGFEPYPENFYQGWVRWYPVFIATNTLFATRRTALGVTALSVGWTIAYFVVFCSDRPPEIATRAFADMIETSTINALVGAISIASIQLVQRAIDTAEAEAARHRALAAELEGRVIERTQALRTAFAERQAVLANLADGVVAVDPGGRISVANRAVSDLLRLGSDPTGQIAAEALPEALTAVIVEAMSADALVTADIALPEGRVGKVAASPVRSEEGALEAVVLLVRDVTLEREVDRLKTDFIATVSHELRTPLTSVLGFAKIIRSRLEQQVFPHVPTDDPKGVRAVEQVRGNVAIVVSEGERLTALINDVLDISKMEAGRMEWRREPVDVAALVERSVAAVSGVFRPDGLQLRVAVEADLPALTGDPDRLVQVLVNLLSNAVKFTERGHVEVGARRVDSGVELWVADTGAGIAAAQHAAVFERFRQVGDTLTGKPQGTGLGLPICLQIVRAHGGEIVVESEVGAGARFSFVIPDATSLVPDALM